MPTDASASAAAAPGAEPDLGPHAVVYPFRRIERPAPTPWDGPDPYGDHDPAWLRIDWSRHLRWIEVEGTPVNCAILGEGPPIVFVHGLGGCWQNWLDNMPYLAGGGFRTIALDLPGFGESPLPPWEITVPAYARVIDGLCTELGLEEVTLVGNSMGGFIAAESATGSPAWLRRLALVSAAGISHARMRREPAMVGVRMLNALNPLMARAHSGGLRRPGVRQATFGGVFRHPQRIRPELLYEYAKTATRAPGFLLAAGALMGYDFLDRLPQIAVPTLLVWGRDDLVVPAADAPGYSERIPDSELHIFNECGHVPQSERPLRFNRLLEGFIGRR